MSCRPLANRSALSDLLARYCAWTGALPLLPSREALQRCSQRLGARARRRGRVTKAAKPHSGEAPQPHDRRAPDDLPRGSLQRPKSISTARERTDSVLDDTCVCGWIRRPSPTSARMYPIKIMALYAVESVIGPQYYE